MKKARVREFLEKLAGECPGVKLEWTSTVANSVYTDVVYAEMYLRRHEVVFTNKAGIQNYGRTRSFHDIHSREWIHKFSCRRTLSGQILTLETFI